MICRDEWADGNDWRAIVHTDYRQGSLLTIAVGMAAASCLPVSI